MPKIYDSPGVVTSVRKTTDQATTANHSTMRNVTDLALPVAANETRYFKFLVRNFSGATTTGLKLAVVVPAGASVSVEAIMTADSSYVTPVLFGKSGSGAELSTGAAPTASATPGIHVIEGVCINGANAGNIQLQFGASVNAVTTIQAGSRGYSWI